MQLFEDPIGELLTCGPATVVKVEQRREQRARSIYDTGKMEWEEFGVVIYMAAARAVPVQSPDGSWGMQGDAYRTRILMIADSNGSCEVPDGAGRLLGHFRQSGRRWWAFLEKPGSSVAPSPPAPGAQRKSDAVSQPAKAAPGARGATPGKPSERQASPHQQRPQGSATQGGQ